MEPVDQLLALPIARLRERYLSGATPMPRGLIEALDADPRRGARSLAAQLRAREHANQAEGRRLRHLLQFETALWKEGYRLIAGVDEAGIGPMAGPVVAGAVILPENYHLRQLDDSKKLTEAKREALAIQIKADAVSWAIGMAEVEEIDRINIYQAGLLAMRRAVESLGERPDYLLVDARTVPQCEIPQRGIIHGDALSASIAAASILAKTTRDRLMIELDREYPGYGLAIHKGYVTEAHLRAMRERGVLPIHRRSFRPVREAQGD